MPKSQHSRFDPSILRYSGTWRAADEAVLNNVHEKNPKKSPLLKYCDPARHCQYMYNSTIPQLKYIRRSCTQYNRSLLTVRQQQYTKNALFHLQLQLSLPQHKQTIHPAEHVSLRSRVKTSIKNYFLLQNSFWIRENWCIGFSSWYLYPVWGLEWADLQRACLH